MDTSYLHDAFKSLEILDEDVYDISEDGAFDKAKDELEVEPEDVIDVIDMDFEDETDMPEEVEEETHIGDVIFDCPVCHSKIYKHPDEVVIDENEEYANVGEECPYCFTSDGFKIIGQIAPYQEEEIKVDIEDKVTDDDETEEVEDEEDIEVNESLKRKTKKRLTEATSSYKFDKDDIDMKIKAKDPELHVRLKDAGKLAQYLDSKGIPYKIRNIQDPRTKQKLKGFIIHDYFYPKKNKSEKVDESFDYEDYPGWDFIEETLIESSAEWYDSKKEFVDELMEFFNDYRNQLEEDGVDFSKIKPRVIEYWKQQHRVKESVNRKSEKVDESRLTEKNWSYTIKSGAKLRRAIEDEDYEAVKEALIDCYSELFNAGIIDEDDYDTYVSEVEFLDAEDEDTLDDFDYELSDFYDLCDNLNVWVALDESLKKSKKVREGFEKVELETDDQKITVKSEPRMGSEEVPAIMPVSDETKDEIAMNTEEEDSEVESNDEESIDYDIDEFDEENFDELGESYLKNVYGNVKSFKTVNLGQLKNQLIIEGLITFNSGKQKKTRFVFEAKNATKKGKLSFIGENLQLSRGKKSFVLRGQYNKGKFMSESLNYNYRTKDKSGKSTKVYGTVKVKK